MKEAAGEANLTVIAIVLIAVVAAIATPLITNMMSTTGKKSCCTQAGGEWANGKCNQTTSGTYDASTYNDCIGDLDK